MSNAQWKLTMLTVTNSKVTPPVESQITVQMALTQIAAIAGAPPDIATFAIACRDTHDLAQPCSTVEEHKGYVVTAWNGTIGKMGPPDWIATRDALDHCGE